MKWFKHFSSAKYDKKIMRVVNKYGIEGYGLYFAILESIAFQLEADKSIPDLEEEAQDIAMFFKMDTLKVEEIIKYCVEQELFQIDPNTKRIVCLKMLTHLDNHLSRNPEIKKIINNFDKLRSNYEVSTQSLPTDSKQIRLDEIRLDDNKEGGLEEVKYIDDSKSIIDYLNDKANKKFSYKQSSIKNIRARFADGFKLDDLKAVIDIKCADKYFKENPKYLNPETLFRPGNFEKYLNEKPIEKKPENTYHGSHQLEEIEL